MIEVKIDTKEIERIAELLSNVPKGMEKATSSAINRTLQSSRTAAVKKARQIYDIKTKDLRSTITLKRSGDSGAMISRGSPLPLIKFKVAPNKPNPRRSKIVSVSVKRSGGVIKGGFIPELDSGQRGVFVRAGKNRLPIRELYGPSSPQMIGEKSVIEEVQKTAEESMIKRLSHEAVRLLGRY